MKPMHSYFTEGLGFFSLALSLHRGQIFFLLRRKIGGCDQAPLFSLFLVVINKNFFAGYVHVLNACFFMILC